MSVSLIGRTDGFKTGEKYRVWHTIDEGFIKGYTRYMNYWDSEQYGC